MIKLHDRVNKPIHTVVQYNYTMEGSRDAMLTLAQKEKIVSFEKIFEDCEDRVQAIFLFLSGMNNSIIRRSPANPMNQGK